MHFSGDRFVHTARRGIRAGGSAKRHWAHPALTIPGIGTRGRILWEILQNRGILPLQQGECLANYPALKRRVTRRAKGPPQFERYP